MKRLAGRLTGRPSGLRDDRAAVPPASAEVDARGAEVFVTPWSLIPSGLWKVNPSVEVLPAEVPAVQLGTAVLAALDQSEAGLNDPDENTLSVLLRAAGVRSWAEYVRGLAAVSINRRGSLVKIVPQRNLGAREGLEPLTDATETLTQPDAGELGAAVVRGLDASRRASGATMP